MFSQVLLFTLAALPKPKKKAKGIGGWHSWIPGWGSSPCNALAFYPDAVGVAMWLGGFFLKVEGLVVPRTLAWQGNLKYRTHFSSVPRERGTFAF